MIDDPHELIDDPHDTFARLGTLEVPRHLDPGTVRARGHRRLVRRRLLAGAGSVGVAAAATASVIALSGALLGGPDRGLPSVAGGGTPTAGPSTARATAPATARPRTQPSTGPYSRDNPLARWDGRWLASLTASGVPISTTRGSAYDFKHGSVETYSAVLHAGATGYLSLEATVDPVAVAKARRDPCTFARRPKDGTGGQCRQQGDAWIRTYASSNQGPVQVVRVVTARADVVISQSTGFPSYKPSEDRPGLLIWDLRDPVYPEQPSKRRHWPALDQLPLTTAVQIGTAKDLATNAPRL